MLGWEKLRHDRRALAVAVGAPLVAAFALGAVLLTGPAPEPEPTPTGVITPSPSPSPSPTARPTRRPTPSPSPSPTPGPEALGDGRLTILVLGSDSDAARRARGKAYLTDAITVVSARADGSDPILISLPRDSVDLPMPDGGTWTSKVNSLATLRGAAIMRDTMSLLLGITIDHYVLVDMDDFRRIVDAVGGVTVDLPYTLADRRCTIAAGRHHLDGSLALCFARHRSMDSDYARAGRHQQLLLAIRDQVLAGEVDLAALAAGLASLQTDMQASDLMAYAEVLSASAQAEASRLVLAPPTYTTFVGTAGARGWISIPNVPVIRQAVAELIGD